RGPAGGAGRGAEEVERVAPVITALGRRGLGPVSVDTRKAAVAQAALEAGAAVVNDVSGLAHDPALAGTVAAPGGGAGLILMHMRGTPDTMDGLATYHHVAGEVAAELRAAAERAEAAGGGGGAVAVDPG